jgi:NADPH-dependent 2,4-dienoyl-CoA reductase/sulfur reductase-like enzyme
MTEPSLDSQIVVVGAGPAGLAAACAAAQSGQRVTVIDNTPWLGGQIWRGQSAQPSNKQARRWFERFARSGATLLPNTGIIAAPAPGLLLGESPQGPCQIHYSKLILATGARELFLPFPGWTLPGVFGPGGLQAMVKAGWPVQHQRVVVAGSGPLLLAVAQGLRHAGARVLAVAEQAPWSQVLGFGLRLGAHPAKLLQGARLFRPGAYSCGTWPLRAEGAEQVTRVTLTNGQRSWTLDCDLIACAFGLVPNLELPLALGCELHDGFVRVDPGQTTSVANVYCAGEPTGIGGVDCALVEGQIAGYTATGNHPAAQALLGPRAAWHRFRRALAAGFSLRPELKSLAAPETIVCRCEDVPLATLRRFTNWREAKLQSRCGMGPCQGRICGAATQQILGWGMESVRPPLLPARVGSLIHSIKP